MQKIEGTEKNLKQLLLNTKYTIHYYQRGYMWQRKNIAALINDLVSEFTDSYREGDPRSNVKDYGAYFMGSIVLAGRENAIIDGQQRLSSLTLLLMYLNNRLRETDRSYSMVEQMIFSEAYGQKSFNLNIDERKNCMNAIFRNDIPDYDEANDSVRNLYGRYMDITELFPSDLIDDNAILHFCDWLAERVYFIEITASAEQDAYKIFVTMNDRGLSLTPTEMLKGYILSEVREESIRNEFDSVWKKTVQALTKNDPKGDEAFFKAWLRAQYAETTREPRAGAVNKDFETIGTSFHNWVRDEREKLGLHSSEDYEDFMLRIVEFSEVYLRIRQAENNFSEDTQYVFYNAKVDFTFQAQLLLAPICYGDNYQTVTQKMNLTARFIEIYILSSIIKGRRLSYEAIRNYVFDLTKAIRGLDINALKNELAKQYFRLRYNPRMALPDFMVNRTNKRYVKCFLARIICFLEEQTGGSSHYCEYTDSATKNPYEIEHIISNHYERFTEEYTDQKDFARWRNSIGALLLLRKKINASLNDLLYEDKLAKYCSSDGNIYSASLGEQAYVNNPGFIGFIRDNNLPFEPCEKFGKREISQRIALLIRLFGMIWNADMFR